MILSITWWKHQSAPFVWLFYRMYLAVASVHFLNLTMDWYGGEKELLDRIGPSNKVDMRISPCCCLLCLPTDAQLTRHKIKVLKILVRQMPYVQSGMFNSIFMCKGEKESKCENQSFAIENSFVL